MPLAGLALLGILAAAQAFHPILRPKVFQYTTNHVHANIWALIVNLGDPERAGSAADSLKNRVRFLSFRTLQLTDALLFGRTRIDRWLGPSAAATGLEFHRRGRLRQRSQPTARSTLFLNQPIVVD